MNRPLVLSIPLTCGHSHAPANFSAAEMGFPEIVMLP